MTLSLSLYLHVGMIWKSVLLFFFYYISTIHYAFPKSAHVAKHQFFFTCMCGNLITMEIILQSLSQPIDILGRKFCNNLFIKEKIFSYKRGRYLSLSLKNLSLPSDYYHYASLNFVVVLAGTRKTFFFINLFRSMSPSTKEPRVT